MLKALFVCVFFIFFVNCGGSYNQMTSATSNEIKVSNTPILSAENIVIPDNSKASDYNILLLGNSHISGISDLLKSLINKALPDKNVYIESAGGIDYLEERLRDPISVELLTSNKWSHVILQAQKYSQSGTVTYPTSAAQTWIQLAKSQNTTPILFPEHPQKGHSREGRQVHKLHLSIAALQASCVAPVGLAWDRALTLQPELKLHAHDGNHAAFTGAFLTSLVFYEVITGMSADLLPYIANIDIEKSTQDFLGQVASATILENVACKY